MKDEFKKYAAAGLTFAVVLTIVYVFIHNISWLGGIAITAFRALKPFVFGCIIAYVVGILMTRYEKIFFPGNRNSVICKSRRPLCLILALATIVLAIVLIIKILLPQLILSAGLIINEVPKAAEKFYNWLMRQDEWKALLSDTINSTKIDWKLLISNLGNVLVNSVTDVMSILKNIVSGTFNMVVQLAIGFIFAIYILLGKEKLGRQLGKISHVYIKEATRKRVSYVLHVADDTFRNFVVGQCTEAVIIGVLCAIGMKLIGLPYGGMTGAVVGLTALVPIVGAYIGAAVGAFMICTVSPMDAVIFLIFLVILQQVEGNLIYPRVVGTSIGLPGIWVLFSVTVCGGIWGIPGMLLGVPAVATIYKLLKADVAEKYQPEPEEEPEDEAEEETDDETEK